MKYYTPELLERFASDDEQIALAAQDELEHQAEQYAQHVKSVVVKLPPRFRELQERFYLHDARLLRPSFPWLPAKNGPTNSDKLREIIEDMHASTRADAERSLMLPLELDAPPKGIVVLHYRGVRLENMSLNTRRQSRSPDLLWRHDEIELVRAGKIVEFLHSILFSDGLELRIQFADFDFATLKPLSVASSSPNGRARTAS